MKLEFDLGNVRVSEFGVGWVDNNVQTFVMIPVDAEVQAALREMVQATWDTMRKDDDGPAKYEPSEKHGSTEYLYLPLEDDLNSLVRTLHLATNLDNDSCALSDPSDVFCYFARLTDTKNRRLTALRRASQFKGVLKRRLIRLVSDSLKLIEDSVFKLDNDFDLLVDSANVHILRPSGFESVGKLQEAILAGAPNNIERIRKELSFVDFTAIEAYASSHPRAARHLASIRWQAEIKRIDKAALKRLCVSTGVEVSEVKGKIIISDGHELGFLEVLDRRRYEVNLVKKKPESFRAASRRKIDRDRSPVEGADG